MVDIVGIDYVCIGTDKKMATPNKIEFSKNKPMRVGEQTNNVWQNQSKGFYYEMVENMLKIGFTENKIVKIGSGNYLRFFDAATQGQK